MPPPPKPPSSTSPRFTRDGNDQLETHLAQICALAARGLESAFPRRQLETVLLGGGYGRGEGGVLRSATADRPYNDLEFYVGLGGHAGLNERLHRRALHRLAHDLTHEAGIEVEFKIFSPARFARSAVTMFSYDLVAGHRMIAGELAPFEGCDRHRRAENIPPSEATRLMMNRCSGLLFARERLARPEFTDDDADFVARNLAKAQLALGDAVLAALGKYHWSTAERNRLLVQWTDEPPIECWEAIRSHHHEGTAFKFHPTATPATARDELAARWAELSELGRRVLLWVENRRLGRSFASVPEYALSRDNKCPESPAWRNALLHLFHGLTPRALAQHYAWRYPRQRLLDALPLLLWECGDSIAAPYRPAIQRQLLSQATDLPGLLDAYRALWVRFR